MIDFLKWLLDDLMRVIYATILITSVGWGVNAILIGIRGTKIDDN